MSIYSILAAITQKDYHICTCMLKLWWARILKIVSDLQPQRRKVSWDERLLFVHCPSVSWRVSGSETWTAGGLLPHYQLLRKYYNNWLLIKNALTIRRDCCEIITLIVPSDLLHRLYVCVNHINLHVGPIDLLTLLWLICIASWFRVDLRLQLYADDSAEERSRSAMNLSVAETTNRSPSPWLTTSTLLPLYTWHVCNDHFLLTIINPRHVGGHGL